jgi:putative flippase GtrA
MAFLIVALLGVIVLEAIYIIVTKSVSNELVAVISALAGSVTTAFLMGKKT